MVRFLRIMQSRYRGIYHVVKVAFLDDLIVTTLASKVRYLKKLDPGMNPLRTSRHEILAGVPRCKIPVILGLAARAYADVVAPPKPLGLC